MTPPLTACVFCGRLGADPLPPGWLAFGSGGTTRCPTCASVAVHTQEEARRRLPGIRADMAAIGLDLPERVQVRVVSYADAVALVGAPATGLLLGATEQHTGGPGGRRVVRISVVAGLPDVFFGRAVAHEIGHAWLGLRGAEPVDDLVEEGVCELFAYAWLKRLGTPAAQALRESMHRNPEPVYGGGFRLVHATVQRHGVAAVLAGLLDHGALPQLP